MTPIRMNKFFPRAFFALLIFAAIPALLSFGTEDLADTDNGMIAEKPSMEMQKSGDTTALRSPASFADIEGDDARAASLFEELSQVLMHPRCVNCHPSGDEPRQGDESVAHRPLVRRGVDGFGLAGMRCGACHHATNFDPGRIPGAPHWHLAPRSMAWEGLSSSEICAQLKDPERNGGRDLEAIVKHMRDDPLVGWAWDPGQGREAAPGTQEQFGALLRAWVDAGAACP